MREVHGVNRPALGGRPQIGGVAKHLRKRYQSPDHLGVGPPLHALDTPTTRVEVANHVAHEVFGRDNLYFHNGLQEHGLRLAGRLLKAHRRRDLKRHLRRVDFVVRTVEERHLDVDHGITGQNAAFHGFFHAGLHRGDVLLGHHAADDLVDKLEAGAGFVGLHLQPDVTVLAAATRLADELALLFHRLADRPR